MRFCILADCSKGIGSLRGGHFRQRIIWLAHRLTLIEADEQQLIPSRLCQTLDLIKQAVIVVRSIFAGHDVQPLVMLHSMGNVAHQCRSFSGSGGTQHSNVRAVLNGNIVKMDLPRLPLLFGSLQQYLI